MTLQGCRGPMVKGHNREGETGHAVGEEDPTKERAGKVEKRNQLEKRTLHGCDGPRFSQVLGPAPVREGGRLV